MEDIEKKACKIVRHLKNNGFITYFAGGCVRDKILNRQCKDIDIATSARPQDIIRLFKNTIKVGMQFGVVIVVFDKTHFEIATFRKDGKYSDGRHPDLVSYSSEKEDVFRRDFTINGMLYDPIDKKIIDHVGGLCDIQNKCIRSIGNPIKRFNEDKLRMIRAIRFASTLSYEIEENTWIAIRKLAKQIYVVSMERIRDELFKILCNKNAKHGILLLDKAGLLKEIIPEITNTKGVILTKKKGQDAFGHSLAVLEHINKTDKELVLASIIQCARRDTLLNTKANENEHNQQSAKIVQKICTRLKLSNKESRIITSLILNNKTFDHINTMELSSLKRFLRQDNFNMHLELYRANCLATNRKLTNYYLCLDKLKEYSKKELFPRKLIDGNTLIKLGLKPSPLFKDIIFKVENAQLGETIKTKKDAVEYIKRIT